MKTLSGIDHANAIALYDIDRYVIAHDDNIVDYYECDSLVWENKISGEEIIGLEISEEYVVALTDLSLYVYDRANGRLICKLKDIYPSQAIILGNRIYVITFIDELIIVEDDRVASRLKIEHPWTMKSIDSTVAIGCINGSLLRIDNYEAYIVNNFKSWIYSIAYYKEQIAVGLENGDVVITDLKGEIISKTSYGATISALSFLDEKIIAIGLRSGVVYVYMIEYSTDVRIYTASYPIKEIISSNGYIYVLSVDDYSMVSEFVILKCTRSMINIENLPQSIHVGENTTISGYIDPPHNTRIILEIQEDGIWSEYMETTSDSITGYFEFNVMFEDPGNYTVRIRAEASEEYTPTISNIYSINVVKYSVTINAEIISSTTLYEGESFSFKLKVEPTSISVDIYVYIRSESEDWKLLEIIENVCGEYTYKCSLSPGNYYIKFCVKETRRYLAAESSPIKLSVMPFYYNPSVIMPPVGIAVASVAGMYIYYIKRKRTIYYKVIKLAKEGYSIKDIMLKLYITKREVETCLFIYNLRKYLDRLENYALKLSKNAGVDVSWLINNIKSMRNIAKNIERNVSKGEIGKAQEAIPDLKVNLKQTAVKLREQIDIYTKNYENELAKTRKYLKALEERKSKLSSKAYKKLLQEYTNKVNSITLKLKYLESEEAKEGLNLLNEIEKIYA